MNVCEDRLNVPKTEIKEAENNAATQPSEKQETRRKGAGDGKTTLPARVALGVAAPIVAFLIVCLMETGGGFLSTVPFGYALLNIALYGAVYLLLLSLTRSTKIAAPLLGAFAFALGGANYYTVLWRQIPITMGDVKAFATVNSVLEGYNFVIPGRFFAAAGLLLAFIACVMFLPTRRPESETKQKLLRSGAGVLIAAAAFVGLLYLPVYDVDILAADGVHFERVGYAVGFIADAKRMEIKPPEGYSADAVQGILDEYADGTGTKAEQHPDIIVIMNESMADLRSCGEFETNIEVMPYLESMREGCISGEVLTFGQGGGTSLSEFELLTRSSQTMMPYTSVPYLQYITEPTPTLPSALKQLDVPYHTTAFHAAQAINYSRDKVYPLFGIDEFFAEEHFADLSSPRGYLDDRQFYQRMLEYLDAADPNEPQFMFGITIQNHGGYFDTCELPVEDVEITDFEAPYDVERYLTLMRQTDEALEWLIGELSARERPTVLLVFGDHQPLLGRAFYEQVMGDLTKLTPEEQLSRHITPFRIWSNYGLETRELGLTSLNYLPGFLLEAAGLPLTEYDRFLMDMHEEIPAMNGCMYYKADGSLHKVGDEENEWLERYRAIQYNVLFDREGKCWRAFEY